MIDQAELRRMSPAERRQLATMLAEVDGQGADEPAAADPYLTDPALGRQRRIVLIVSAASCLALAGWIVVLAATLPHHFNAHHWRPLWVNFDVIMLAAFALTAWATWRKRQVLILLLMLLGTMLCCDAWFDVGTSLGTSSMGLSIADAVFAELPLAFLAFTGARRLLKATVEAGLSAPAVTGAQPAVTGGRAVLAGSQPTRSWRAAEGADRASGPSLRRTPLAGAGLEEAFPGSRAMERAERAERARQRAGRGAGAK